jgi:PilZ domain
VRDVSATGLFVAAPAPLSIGMRVAVVPLLDDTDGVRFAAEVVRIEGKDGVALRFLDEEDLNADRRTPAWARRRALALVPPNAPELLIADDGTDAVDELEPVAPIAAAATPTEQHCAEQRRAPRVAHTLVVSVRGCEGGRRLHAVDVGPTGMFVVSDSPPPQGARVHVTLRMPAAVLFAIARVTRTVPSGAVNAEPGFGLEIVAMADEDQHTWASYVELLSGPHAELATSGAVVVRPDNLARLRDFESWDLTAGGTMLFASALHAPGAGVLVIVVHPQTGAEMHLPAVVVNAHAEPPRRMDVCFLDVNDTLRARFRVFVESGRAPPLLALPAHTGSSTSTLSAARTAGPSAGERALALASENAKLRARIDELESELTEAERSERFLFNTLHVAESKQH